MPTERHVEHPSSLLTSSIKQMPRRFPTDIYLLGLQCLVSLSDGLARYRCALDPSTCPQPSPCERDCCVRCLMRGGTRFSPCYNFFSARISPTRCLAVCSARYIRHAILSSPRSQMPRLPHAC